MSITYRINKEFNGIEIKFTEKPSKAILEKLKALGFRWHSGKCVWYAKNTPERLEFAKSIQDKNDYSQITMFPEETEAEEEKSEKPAKKSIDPRKKSEPKATKKKADVKKAEPKKAEETKEEQKTEKKANIVQFPKERPSVRVAITEGSATYEECEAKLLAERKIFCDSDSRYVIDGLLKMCEVNPNFRNNLMRPDKTYAGAFAYFVDMAKKGYAMSFNGCTYLDNDTALGFAMDYYNMVDEVKEG